MHNTGTALLIKFLMTFAFSIIAFNFLAHSSLGWAFLVSLIVTGSTYMIGDLMIAPSWGSTISSMANAVMAVGITWIVSLISPNVDVGVLSLLIFGALLGIGEYFFHQYSLKTEEMTP